MVSIKFDGSRSASDTGTHASPRLHWRRGHIRKTKTGKVTWVRAHLVGAAENGVLMKDYAA